ncbi:hypothetical protein A2382_04345 [Candidatus Woesebacteria bacterium RIFOXYB1_FULL_38_16]|uniref:Uncharacterized protein n=1 Tax=Candidatus Woesebacteria bacterium RIFOXYB1_FULL_38_16 TaxID=1802538 RepID=A0A1F8CU17_9BACT|nr:MAG: hypothetical protein A2191_04425 [Candidatus Woesebacteria bacterium RIFOXYA1_FULL_38_9]OGM79800.1 MAG: hypothetical protein A2382_04345 [Candidatus Woesebacteria bacterium RIFOXYB1_FULL_38_16]
MTQETIILIIVNVASLFGSAIMITSILSIFSNREPELRYVKLTETLLTLFSVVVITGIDCIVIYEDLQALGLLN